MGERAGVNGSSVGGLVFESWHDCMGLEKEFVELFGIYPGWIMDSLVDF
jgi:hypothetical protein